MQRRVLWAEREASRITFHVKNARLIDQLGSELASQLPAAMVALAKGVEEVPEDYPPDRG